MVKRATQKYNPRQKAICPFCHLEYFPGECRIIATLPFPPWKPGDVIQEATTGFFARNFVTPLTGLNFVRAGATRVCPRCNEPLPQNDVATYTIAVVGDVSSGKSLYLASCLHQLQQAAAYQVIGCNAVLGIGNTDLTYNNDYYAPTYINKKAMGLTGANVQPKPLIYELVFPGKSINLLFYDASGEDMVNPTQMAQYGHYILNASAIIFLADPMAMPGIYKSIPDHIRKQQALRTISTAQALTRVISTFKRGQGQNQGDRLTIPIAITISKSDLLDFTEKKVSPSLYLRDMTLTSGLDIGQFSIVDQQVRDLLRRHGDSVLIRASTLFETVSFFAVSATGWPTDNNDEFPKIEPRRCLEPLLWTLWQLGIINDM